MTRQNLGNYTSVWHYDLIFNFYCFWREVYCYLCHYFFVYNTCSLPVCCTDFSFATWFEWHSVVQSLSHVRLFVTPWTSTCQASLSITNSWSLPKLISIELVMPSNHLILCHPLLLLTSIFPSIRVFSNKSALCIRWPKYWSFSFNISPSNEHPARFIILLMCCWIRCASILLRIFLGHGSNLNFHQQRNG